MKIPKRKFSSYGPVSTKTEYFVPREELIQKTIDQLVGKNPDEGGHYFTVWAPRQTGKTWLMWQTLYRLKAENNFTAVCMSVGLLKDIDDDERIFAGFKRLFETEMKTSYPELNEWDDLKTIFTKKYFEKPLILIIDEFDALKERTITTVANIFREIYLDLKKMHSERLYCLHGVALIGVRSVLGIENKSGSPFNVQRSLHIDNLTFDEVKLMFDDYQQEWGQKIDNEVVEQLYYETNGQPGLVSWFGELLTEKHNLAPDQPITIKQWKHTYAAASFVEPNNTIMNLISKANQPEYRGTLLQLFKTDEKTPFKFDHPHFNFLYMNGVITFSVEESLETGTEFFAKFSCPFVQKRLFNRFCDEYFEYIGRPYDPTLELDDIFLKDEIQIYPLLKMYETYLQNNKHWINKTIPLRNDGRFYEAFYHFNFFRWLFDILIHSNGYVIPEFPTGNGKIDLIISYADKKYALELKSFSRSSEITKAVQRCALYGKHLKLNEIHLIYFYDFILPPERIAKYETQTIDADTGVMVKVIFLHLDR